MFRNIEVYLIKAAYNPLVKDPFVGCIFGMLLSLGVAATPWAYNLALMAYGLYIFRRPTSSTSDNDTTPNAAARAQERFTLAIYGSLPVDLVIEFFWVYSVVPDLLALGRDDYAGSVIPLRRLLEMLVFVELIIIKSAIRKAALWRLRDEGYCFESALNAWGAREMYGNYFGETDIESSSRTPAPAPYPVPVEKLV